MSEAYEPKLVHLPGSKLTPEVVLHRTLNKLPRIKAIAIVILPGSSEMFGEDWQTVLRELFGPLTGAPSLRRFVEWMMGYPRDWTVTEKQPPSRRSGTR